MLFPFKYLIAAILLFMLSITANAAEQTEVVVIASMHGAHKAHATYNYQTLFSLVESYKPDFVGVEIRQEDINADVNYLKANYPYEMIELSQRYKNRAFGFDWLGDEIKGQSIPAGYFKNLKVLNLSRQLYADSELLKRRPAKLNKLEMLQEELIQAATPASFNNGKYGQICREIDKLEQVWLKDTPYEEILRFHQTRDIEIGSNIISFIEKNKGSRIVLVLGADHRTFAIENIEKHFANDVKIIPVF